MQQSLHKGLQEDGRKMGWEETFKAHPVQPPAQSPRQPDPG